MKIASLWPMLAVLPFAVLPAWAGDDDGLARMAMCRDSWFEWQKSDPAKLKAFGEHFRSEFGPSTKDPFFVPKQNVSIAGLRVVEAFPESVGMGVGFSLTVDAPFDQARKAVEKALGKRLQHCETGDNMKACDLEIAAQRTVTLMAEDSPKATQTLVGCYYFYEK